MFHTSNLYVAAVLQLMGNKLADIDKRNPQRAVFYFQDQTKAKADNDKYWAGEVEQNTKQLFDKISELKTLINS